jgi:hypothetical protein
VNLSLFEEVWYTRKRELPVTCRVTESKLSFEVHSLKLQLHYGARTTVAIFRMWEWEHMIIMTGGLSKLAGNWNMRAVSNQRPSNSTG